jgi:hypothetical protein
MFFALQTSYRELTADQKRAVWFHLVLGRTIPEAAALCGFGHAKLERMMPGVKQTLGIP